MKALHACIGASIIVLLGLSLALLVPGVARAGMTASDQVLTGELVVTNAARNQFRIVEHNGFFTAPAGTAVEALDGKPVQVELGHNGRVLQISEMPIHIVPIDHGFEVISGELVLQDPVTGTFAIAGDPRSFTAPRGVDVGRYAGGMVEMRLDEQGRVIDINRILRSADAPVSRSLQSCTFGDVTVISGSSLCRSGRTFRCTDGEWMNVGTPCR